MKDNLSGAAVTSFGLRIPPCTNIRQFAECVAEAEAAGFDVAWIPDSQFLWRDVWAALALAATHTSRIRLGTCVTNLETRHVAVTAAAVATIAEIAEGRVILGIGTGDSSIKTLGLKPTKVTVVGERIEVLRSLLAGESVNFDGRAMRVETVADQPPQIYLAANGPRLLALAGELCDGVLSINGITPPLMEGLVAQISVGLKAAGRAISDIDLCVGTFAHVSSDRKEVAQMMKPYVVATAQTGSQAALRELGIEIDPPAVVGGIYPDMSHARDWNAASQAASEWVSDEQSLRFADAFCVTGSIEECIAQLDLAVSAGASSFYVRHPGSYTLPTELLRSFGEEIIPRFKLRANPISSND